VRWPDVIAILSLALSGGIFAIVGLAGAGDYRASSAVVVDSGGNAALLDTLLPEGEVGLIIAGPPELPGATEIIEPAESIEAESITPSEPPSNPNCININTAAEVQLITIRGIGPVLAGSIVQYRTEHGPFRKKEDLRNVKGIGPAKFAQIVDHICL
jgi:competence protein ComEA